MIYKSDIHIQDCSLNELKKPSSYWFVRAVSLPYYAGMQAQQRKLYTIWKNTRKNRVV